MKTILMLALSASLAACTQSVAEPVPAGEAPPQGPSAAPSPPRDAAPPPAVAPVSIPYTAQGGALPRRGNRWRVVIDEGRMLIGSPTSAGWYIVPRPQPEIADGRHVFRTEQVTITVEPGGCTAAAQGDAQLDAVTLEWDGGTFQGCGGPRTGPGGLTENLWELVRLGNEAPPPDRSPAATLGFSSDGRVGGSHVCNSIGTNVRWRADGSFARDPDSPAFMGTAIGCYGPGHDIGARFWSLVATAVGWRQEGERLIITGANGQTAELRYLIS